MNLVFPLFCWFRSFLIKLNVTCIVFFSLQVNILLCSEQTLLIKNVELLRRGKQISVSLHTNMAPLYEITENLSLQTLVIKFKNARVFFPDDRMERFFNDHQLAGIRFSEIGSDIWAQFKLLEKNLSYSVTSLENFNGIKIDFRPVFQVYSISDPPEDASYILDEVKFDSRNTNFTSVIFNFSKNYLHTSRIVPEDKQPPRIFLLEDKNLNRLRIRLPNTLPKKNLGKIKFSGSRISIDELNTEVNQTFVDINLKIPEYRIEKNFTSKPIQWKLNIYGDPKKIKTESLGIDIEKLTPKDITNLEEEKKSRKKRGLKINPTFRLGENAFREKKYDEAVKYFKEAYAIGKENSKGEFKDPLDPLAARSLFRVGDTIFKMLERRIGNNYHQAIDAYKTAIRITEDEKKIALEKGANFDAVSLIPHANFRIGRAYQKMNFHHEAEVYYNILQDKFPNSNQAIEANFWKGISKVDQRQWEAGITNFQSYLRTSSKPKFFAITHYKMAQAYYHLERYITAREFFDIARETDNEYVKNDPTLLFHMGETYYENADYATAREIFRMLLQKFPKADFSKLVALRLGDFFRDEGNEDEAIKAYKNAIGSYTREIALLGKLRIANIKSKRPHTGEYIEAINVYDEITKLYPETPQAEEAMLRHGLTLTLYGFYSKAIKTLEKFLKKYPRNIYVTRNVIQESIDENIKGLIDYYFRQNDYFALASTYNDYKSKYLLNFRFDITLFQAAFANRKLGFSDEALDILNFLENKSSGTISELVQFEKANILLEKEDYTEARNTIVSFINNYPESPYDAEVRKLLALIYRKQNFFPRALIVYNQTIEKYEQNKDPIKSEIVPELYFDLGKLFEDKGNFNQAGESFQKSISSYNYPLDNLNTPEYIINSHFLAGDMYNKAQNYETALESYFRAISLYGTNKDQEILEKVFWSRFQVGIIYKNQGKKQKALKIFKDLFEQQEGDGTLWKKLAKENYREISNIIDYGEHFEE